MIQNNPLLRNSTTIFHDIDDSFAKDDIEKLITQWVIRGYEDGTFRPEKYVSRAEFLKITMKWLGLSMDESLKSIPFSDVTIDWQIPIVANAVQLWIISTNQTLFRPNDPITRAEAVKILLKAAWLDWRASGAYFIDVWDEYAWSIPYMNTAYVLNIIQGQYGRFRPKDPITRAETVKIVSRTNEVKK